MIVDSSALIAVVRNEGDEASFFRAMAMAPVLRISAANWVEAWIVVDNLPSPFAAVRFQDLLDKLGIQIVPVSEQVAYRARVAHLQFGRGHHAAKLNFGDCFSYALSKLQGEPLLFKGEDFSKTDIEPALKT